MLVVTGHPRSGTTILQQVLSQHPDVAMTNELQCLVGLGQPVRLRNLRRLARRGFRRRNHLRAFRPDPGPWPWGGNAWATARILGRIARRYNRPLDITTVERAYRAVYPAARWVGDKSPTYVFDLEPLLATEATVLVIYRDPRDVVASTLAATRERWQGMRHARALDTAFKVAHHWVRAIEAMEAAGDRVMVLRYEQLVREPTRVLGEIAARLGIDPGPLPDALLHPSSIGRHRTTLTDDDLATMTDIAGATMGRLGYD